jgi:putative transposase
VNYKRVERLHRLEGLVVRRRSRKRMAVRLSLDHGSECRSRAFDAWAADRDIALRFMQPGKPTQNSHIESFNGRLRDECLNQHWFLSLRDAQFHIERWRWRYNTDRPHIALLPLTPTEFARTFPSPTSRLSA